MIWTIVGVSVAIVAIFCIAMVQMAVGHPLFEEHRIQFAIALAGCGAATWIVGSLLARKREEDASEENGKTFVLFDLRYWGPVLITLGAITFFIQTVTNRIERIVVARMNMTASNAVPVRVSVSTEAPPAPLPSAPDTNVVKARVEFPLLKVQGLFVRENRAVVILNGRSYEEGDAIGDVIVKTISRRAVTLEKSGETKLLSLDGETSGVQITSAGK